MNKERLLHTLMARGYDGLQRYKEEDFEDDKLRSLFTTALYSYEDFLDDYGQLLDYLEEEEDTWYQFYWSVILKRS